MKNRLTSYIVLVSCLLGAQIVPIDAIPERRSRYIETLMYKSPCPPGYEFDPLTGNFMCAVPTASKCFELCQENGCTEWSFLSFLSSKNEDHHNNRRCRCVPEYSICTYTYIPQNLRLYSD